MKKGYWVILALVLLSIVVSVIFISMMPDQVPMQVRRERLHVLHNVQKDIHAQILAEILEQSPCKQVLFETDYDGYAIGHTPEFIEVKVLTDTPLGGTTRAVRLTHATDTVCLGELID